MKYRYRDTLGIIILGILVLLACCFVNKSDLDRSINSSLPPREAGILRGIILGEKDGFDKEFLNSLKNSGVIHIVVVSGSNIMLLMMLLTNNLASYFGRKKVIIFGLVTMWSYVSLVGWEAPILRAAVFVTLYYWTQLLGRKFNRWRTIILMTVIMFLIDINFLKSVSFWMSMTAFLAIVFDPWKTRGIKGDLWSTLWVSIWITPILAYVFGKISLIGPISNAAILFLVEIVTVVGGIGMIAGIILPMLGGWILTLIYPILLYFAKIIEWTGGSKLVTASVNINVLIMGGYYLFLFYLVARFYRKL